MSKRLIRAIAAIVILTMVAIPFISHRGNSAVEITKVDPAFSAYVSAYTSGTISNESYIRVTLANDYNGPITFDKSVDDSYFSFDPAIDGKAYWIDSRTIEFRPDKRLPSDQLYTAEFYVSKVVADVQKDYKTMKFGFRTMKQNFNVSMDAMKTTDRKTLRWQQLTGTLVTADAADPKIVEQLLTVSQNGKNLHIKWEHEGDNVTHRFTVDSIARGDKEGKVTMSTDGKALGLSVKKNDDITIPSLKDFKVTDVRVEQGETQCIVVEFSDPIADKQTLDGLITVKDGGTVRYEIDDNDVKVFPEEQLSGDHRITVSQGIKNILGYKLPNAYTQTLSFEELKPKVKLVGKGVILPNSDRGLLFPFQAVSLKAVEVKVIRIYENNVPQFLQVNDLDGKSELYRVGKVVAKKRVDLNIKSKSDYGKWCNFSLDMNDLIKAEPGAIYHVSIKFKKDDVVYNCADDTTAKPDATTTQDDPSQSSVSDDDNVGDEGYYGEDDYYDYDYDYDSDYRSNPCDDNYYYGKTVSRNILASDLGLVAKRGNDGNMLFAVNNLLTTKPVPGVKLSVYDFQHQLLSSSVSDASGFSKVDLAKKQPFLLVAESGQQRGYLKLDDGSSLSVSAFDVAGVDVQKGLKGFIYGERGVWRPGDTLFLSFILEDKQKLLPATHPVTFELTNARGQLVTKTVKAQSVNGFYTFTTPTDPEAPTGTWTATVKVGGATFTKDIRVETIMPNRLKIAMDFGSKTSLSNTDKSQEVKLHSNWLTGATAKDLRAQVDVSLHSTKTTFKGYENYIFDDPAASFSTDNQTVFDGLLDDNGDAKFDPKLSAENAPGMLKASFDTRVFEDGGAFSSDHFSMDYSPYEDYVGILVPKGSGWGGMLQTGQDENIRVVSVDKNGKPVSRSKISVKVFKVDWRWWWSDEDDDDLARYVSGEDFTPYFEKEISTKNGIGQFTLNIGNDDYGRYLIRVTDEESGHSAGTTSWFDWPYWEGSSVHNTDIASLLQFTSDKTKYNVGETMNLSIPSPGQGRALISIENGSKIISAAWAETNAKGNITYSLPVTSDMAPNVYVNVTLIQPHAQTKNDAPIRLYGVIPVEVDDPATHLTPQISIAATEWKPEQQASVTVSELSGKPMTYTLAVVDEGLLDLTHFQTPDPWGNFYAREALGVKTWDMYDMVMGAYGAELERVLGIGGDADQLNPGGQKANRFKPMVKFLGPFVLKANEKQVQTFMMPQYVGSVRVMVIAGQDGAYGNADKTMPVRKPLMILGTLPRVVGPGETVDLPVDVFAMDKKVKNATITVDKNSFFTIQGSATQTTSFKDIGDNIVVFHLDVAKAVGVGKVHITAKSGNETAQYDIELNVRNANPPMTKAYAAVIDPGQSWSSDYTPVGIAGTTSGTIEISSVPPLNMGQRMHYLIHYPYGCIEQTTSSVFPQLYLADLIKLDDKKKKDIDINIKAGIDRLKKFTTSSGGFAYWPGESDPSEWGSNYAGDFLLEAQAKGYTIPQTMMDKWKKYQRDLALNYVQPAHVNGYYDHTYYYDDDLVQAYRLYTLALANAPELGAMNRLKEEKNLSDAAKWRLAAAYQLAKQPDVALQIVNGIPTTVNPYTEMSYTFGSADRDEAMILETMSLMGGQMRTKAAPLAKTISDALNKDEYSYWMSTQTTAYCLMALCKFSGADKTTKGVNCSYTINGKNGTVAGNELIADVDMNVNNTNSGKVFVKNNGTNTLFVRMVLSGVPEAGNETDASNNLDMDVSFTTMDGKSLDVSKIQQGTDFIAQVTVSNPGLRGPYEQLALTQIFPSGWEIRNTRMDAGQSTLTNDPFDYQDIRDDRVNTFFSLPAHKSKTYTVQLNASYSGHFYLPAFYCEAMYDHTVNASQAGKWVDVLPGPGMVN